MTVAQLLLAWVIRHPGVLAIPKAASIEHVVQNAAALDIVLSGEELAQLDPPLSAAAAKNPAGYGLTHRSRQRKQKPRYQRGFCY
jgi:aryl-alcohol dehydrogenase-like predicted oxidoreductase